MLLFVILDPDTLHQPILVESIEPARTLEDLEVDFYLEGERVLSIQAPAAPTPQELHPCILLYGYNFNGDPRCPVLDISPPHGARYRIEVSAAGRPTAAAQGVVPGDFRIISVSATGEPPGTEGLEVRWTRSRDAWRYVVSIRPEALAGCGPGSLIDSCRRTWFVATADTIVRTTVPREALDGGGGTWYVDVYAMERALYEHLTTGASGDFFSVPPVQNVEAGYGMVGSWVWRTAAIEP